MGDAVFITASGRVVDTGLDVMVKLPVGKTPFRSSNSLTKINIRKDEVCVIMDKEVTAEEMSGFLKTGIDKDPELKVLIRCDKEAKYLYVENVMSICRKVGVPLANIAVKTER